MCSRKAAAKASTTPGRARSPTRASKGGAGYQYHAISYYTILYYTILYYLILLIISYHIIDSVTARFGPAGASEDRTEPRLGRSKSSPDGGALPTGPWPDISEE